MTCNFSGDILGANTASALAASLYDLAGLYGASKGGKAPVLVCLSQLEHSHSDQDPLCLLTIGHPMLQLNW